MSRVLRSWAMVGLVLVAFVAPILLTACGGQKTAARPAGAVSGGEQATGVAEGGAPAAGAAAPGGAPAGNVRAAFSRRQAERQREKEER